MLRTKRGDFHISICRSENKRLSERDSTVQTKCYTDCNQALMTKYRRGDFIWSQFPNRSNSQAKNAGS